MGVAPGEVVKPLCGKGEDWGGGFGATVGKKSENVGIRLSKKNKPQGGGGCVIGGGSYHRNGLEVFRGPDIK